MREKKWLVPIVVDPPDTICVQVEVPNEMRHIAAFWGALEQLSKAYNWEDSYADGSLAAYVWQPLIAQAAQLVRTGEPCMDCIDVRMCLDIDPVALAEAGGLTAIYNSAAHLHIDALEDLYDDVTPQSVFPDIPTAAASDDEDDDDALCYSMRGFVGFYAAVKMNGLTLEDESGSFWDRIKSAAVYAWSEIRTFAGSIWDTLTGGVSLEDAKSSLINDDELEDLACCLWTELRDAPLTETTWDSAIAACASTNDAGAILSNDNSTRTYIYFLEVYNEALQRQIAMEILDCPCTDSCELWAFADEDGGWTIWQQGDFGGEYVAGTGWRTTDIGQTTKQYRLYCKKDYSTQTISKISLTLESASNNFQVSLFVDGVSKYSTGFGANAGTHVWQGSQLCNDDVQWIIIAEETQPHVVATACQICVEV